MDPLSPERGEESGSKHKLGPQSGKAIALSWCAKFGIGIETRRSLGYRPKDNNQSVVSYLCDTLAAPLRRLSNVEPVVSDGTFDPDATRSGMFKKAEKDVDYPFLSLGRRGCMCCARGVGRAPLRYGFVDQEWLQGADGGLRRGCVDVHGSKNNHEEK